MAIVKKGSRLNRGSNSSDVPVRRSTGKPVGNGSSFPASSSDSSDTEPLESIDAHIFQVGDQVCELPLELFDSPDLTHILSLDTWNFVLSDEDRETLVTLLPSMDEDTYRSTLKELFAGETFSFTSPLEDLFELLKSGQCHPKAARCRDVLTSLQRVEHQHDVRVYHNGMVNSFLEMHQIWQGCPDSRIEERMEMWKTWKLRKVRLTPQFFLERKAGPLQNQYFQCLMRRKASYLQAREDAKASQLMAASTPLPDADSKVIGRSRVVWRHKKESSNNVVGNMPNKLKKPHPKGVLKLLPKPVVQSNMDMEMSHLYPLNETSTVPPPAYPEAESSLDDKLFASPAAHEATVSPSVEWSSASPGKEKVVFQIKSENRVKAMESKKVKDVLSRQGGGRGIGSSEKEVDVLECKAYTEKQNFDLTQATELHELQDVNFSVEQMRTHLSGISMHRDGELKKKVKRKKKTKDSDPVENGDGNVFEVNSIEDAFLAEKEVQDILDDKDEPDADEKPVKRRRKRLKAADDSSLPQSCTYNGEASLSENSTPAKVSRKPSAPVPPIAMSFPFSVIHLLSAVRKALITFSSDELLVFSSELTSAVHASIDEDYLISSNAMYLQSNNLSLQGDDGVDVAKEQEENKAVLPYVPLQDIVRKVQANPGDPRVLVTQEPLQGLVRGVLKVLSSKTTQPGMKGWKPLVTYSRRARGWSWIGSVPPAPTSDDNSIAEISHEAWSVPQKTLYKLQELFSNWLKHEQEILQRLGQLALAPPLTSPIFLDEKERFRELRAQKSLITISPTSEEMRAYFRREEALRYSVPDRAFSYTCLDGKKSAVAPLRRIGGKPNSKARDHFMLKPDRPPHVTILCLVRDAAARLPGSIGTRADVCSLIRDSQYIVEEVSDAQLNQVVSGALDRLHYERDPCVRFDGDRKLWVYLHTDKDDEDFEDDATSSTKRWRRTKKEGTENPEFCLTQDYDYPGRDDPDSCGLGLDFSPTSCFGGPSDLSSVYSSAGRNDLPYTHASGSLASPLVLESAFSGSGREDSLLPFIELPPSIQPPCVSMQQSHPMGWEVLSNRWEQDAHFQSHDHIGHEDYSVAASIASSHRDSEVLIDGSI